MAACFRVCETTTMMIAILLFLLHFLSAAKAKAQQKQNSSSSCSSIVDLSQTYFDEADDFKANQDSAKLLDLIQSETTGDDQVYSYLVLENGRKIAEYYNGDATADTTRDVYSIAKSWTGLLFGVMIDQGHIRLEQTVGDIWSYPDHEVWPSVDNEASEVKDITVDQLLSMTSGFVDDTPMAELDWLNVGGEDLAGALNHVGHTGEQNEGKFNYLGFANILGYVVKEATGKTPVEYAQEHIFPFLGMKEGTYEWASNADGVSYTRNGLSLTSTHMAKWAQLYLQNGKASASSEVVSKEWIDTSNAKNVQVTDTSSYVYQSMLGGTPDNGSDLHVFYGKMLFTFADGKHCGFGAGGNFMCFWPEKCRVAAIQMNLFSEAGAASNGILAHKFLALVGGRDVSEADYATNTGGSDEPASEEDVPTSGTKYDKTNAHIRTGFVALSIATVALFL